jgi:CubicO group peptidase (beta-lactamase class C family)
MSPGARVIAAAALAVAASASASATPACPPGPTLPWPDETARVRAGRPRELAALEAYAFTLDGPDAARRGVRTDGLVILHRGALTYERYGRGFGADTPHIAWSVTKSLVGGLAAAAIAEGAVSLDDSVCRHLPSAPPARCGITVRHLLEWASGLDWQESYEHAPRQASSVLAMLYGVGRLDMAGFVLGHPALAEPGAQWAYSSGDSLLLAAVLGAAMEPRHGRDWPWKVLLEPLGLERAVLERDARGTFVGASSLWATPRELARFAQLHLRDGCWGGRRLLGAGWVREATEVSPALRRGSLFRKEGDVTGRALWLNRPVPELRQGVPWPSVPEDGYWMRGHWGQLVAVIPSLELVIVRTGDDRDERAFDPDRFLGLAIAAGRLP